MVFTCDGTKSLNSRMDKVNLFLPLVLALANYKLGITVTLWGIYKVPLASEIPLQFIGSSNAGIPRLTAIAAKSTQGPPYTDHSSTALAPFG
jgi:hypothetical protein